MLHLKLFQGGFFFQFLKRKKILNVENRHRNINLAVNYFDFIEKYIVSHFLFLFFLVGKVSAPRNKNFANFKTYFSGL